MATFTAKTTAELRGVKEPAPGQKTPHASVNYLRHLGDNAFFPRHFQYLHEQHTLADFQRPGYFHKDATDRDSPRDHLRPGDTIHYTMCGGSKDPCDFRRGQATVLSNPTSATEPLILAGIISYPQPTPWRGDDDKSDDDDKVAA